MPTRSRFHVHVFRNLFPSCKILHLHPSRQALVREIINFAQSFAMGTKAPLFLIKHARSHHH
jgi:hypothetical protein